jgi:predicted porin
LKKTALITLLSLGGAAASASRIGFKGDELLADGLSAR